ncbi:MAG: hypothetical protein ABEL76_03635 [Bradymonadaceae bacterium]
MDCLSTPRADTRDEDQRSGPFELGCQPRHATRLDRSIEQRAPSLRPAAATTLQRLDHFRQSRADLRSILVEARDRVRDNRKFLADARADFERRRKELKARRAEFPVQQWRTLRERMRTERKRLAELEAISKRLAERSKEWPKKLAELNHAMYFAITSGWD